MKQFFKPAKLLFYLLSTILCFMLGVTFAGLTGAAKGQGLAGGAIVLGYGVAGAGIAFVAAIITTSYLKLKQVITLNKIISLLVLGFLAVFTYRYVNREKSKSNPADPGPTSQKTTVTVIFRKVDDPPYQQSEKFLG